MAIGDLVRIVWLDSRGCQAGWGWAEDVDTSVCEIHSFGRVIAETDQGITIAPHTGTHEDGSIQCMGCVTIAKCQITSSSILPCS